MYTHAHSAHTHAYTHMCTHAHTQEAPLRKQLSALPAGHPGGFGPLPPPPPAVPRSRPLVTVSPPPADACPPVGTASPMALLWLAVLLTLICRSMTTDHGRKSRGEWGENGPVRCAGAPGAGLPFS